MSFMDIFKINKFKTEIVQLKKENEELKKLLTPEMQQVVDLNQIISKLQGDLSATQNQINKLNQEILSLDKVIEEKKQNIIVLDEETLMQSFGVYTPMYNLMSSEEYNKEIESIREMQKLMIKNKTACNYSADWTVDGSKAKGTKMTNDNIKQILRSFNNECDAVIDKVKYNNIDSIKNRLTKAFNDLNKLNETVRVSLTHEYLNLKIKELNLCYEYAIKKQEEKEEQQRIKEQMREEQKVLKEIEALKTKIEKEEQHFFQAIEQLNNKLKYASSDNERLDLEEKLKEFQGKLAALEKDKQDILNREQNTRAGYVYIISNIGSFGDNVYKIGMTRRLEPMDRVKELGDASVPFNFDVHAMIFSDDAPKLENELHKAFGEKKLNLVNIKREFFKVSLSEIEDTVRKNHNKTVEFTKIAEANEYRQSLEIRKSHFKNVS
jgi:hypothetical protein